MSIPLLVVVNGLPCTGKTTIGKRIAAAERLPLLTKDGIKEIIFDTLGWEDRNWSQSASRCAFNLMFLWMEILLQAGRSMVVEGNFRCRDHAGPFESLRQRFEVRILEVLCKTKGRILWRRFQQRAQTADRHPGHVDSKTFEELKPRLLLGRSRPLEIGDRIVEIDTTDFDGVDLYELFETIAALNRATASFSPDGPG